jgi:hypothetical protein
MPLAAALGRDEFAELPWAQATGLDPERVAIVGLRSLDAAEREAIQDSPVSAYPMSEIDERGIVDVVEDALATAAEGADGLHVSLDMDWLDPKEAPGVGTPVRGGVTYREAHAAMESIADRFDDVRSMEIVEVNPILDSNNRTAELGVELLASALGRRILWAPRGATGSVLEDRAPTRGMDFNGRRGRLALALALAVFATPPLVLVAVSAFGLSVAPSVVVAALGLPLAAITLGLAYLARRVASEPDEPTLIDDGLAERIGMTSEEYRELTEE